MSIPSDGVAVNARFDVSDDWCVWYYYSQEVIIMTQFIHKIIRLQGQIKRNCIGGSMQFAFQTQKYVQTVYCVCGADCYNHA